MQTVPMRMQRVARRAGAGTLAVALAAGLALGLLGPPAPGAEAAGYQEVEMGTDGKATCWYGGKQYSHGSVINQADGKYKCVDGEWKYDGPKA